MILDTLDNAVQYSSVHPGLTEAAEFLRKTELAALPSGRYEIRGDELFAMVARQPGRGREEAKLEHHRRYLDIQVTVSGTDFIGWKALRDCKRPNVAFNEADDYGLFCDEPDSWIKLPPGQFMVLFPEDAHAPLCGMGMLHKVVLKLAVDWKGFE